MSEEMKALKEQLLRDARNGYDVLSNADLAEMERYCVDYKLSLIHICSAIYTVIALVFIFLGTVSGSDFVWEVTDMFNNLIVLPNVIALFALTGMVVASLNEVKKDKLNKLKV